MDGREKESFKKILYGPVSYDIPKLISGMMFRSSAIIGGAEITRS